MNILKLSLDENLDWGRRATCKLLFRRTLEVFGTLNGPEMQEFSVFHLEFRKCFSVYPHFQKKCNEHQWHAVVYDNACSSMKSWDWSREANDGMSEEIEESDAEEAAAMFSLPISTVVSLCVAGYARKRLDRAFAYCSRPGHGPLVLFIFFCFSFFLFLSFSLTSSFV
ncbi:hypothetical protein V1517DRAFT_86854 [Lipomyces orientalis]|uniref:Uncharacterized protein n=1 Tax=Lipomyces orientalis TaxID=1233043 RepID=A0ACC3TRK3_9ASCO